ncbi:hypothetical protein BDQ94DRAFT_164556 [Aspergillus welwitschiae]|uniref:C2H2-type domain-containing protein n=1 Tax=Aspergillus welwitschiae TaxID=1341132 RepID=A0A3F3PHC4_9EURO|nr:hypothetical protein BDQ94DRAFT_164556 [Aspergillus welwitschiae]RDH26354.1 hypothetical protein BDQ94DRAFT_164556 [Aspergillus welwitschiae]
MSMVTPESKRRRSPNHIFPVPKADEHTNDQLQLYRTLTHVTSLPYACPLCLRGYSRYDNLYGHFRRTEEAQHRALKTLWFGSKCPVCSKPTDHVLRHVAMRHPTNYQSLMKPTLRLKHEAAATIPTSPGCFKHTFLFPLRRTDCVVSLPPTKQKRRPHTRDHINETREDIGREKTSLKKRKMETPGSEQDNIGVGEGRIEGLAPTHAAELPCHPTIIHDPPTFVNMIGMELIHVDGTEYTRLIIYRPRVR